MTLRFCALLIAAGSASIAGAQTASAPASQPAAPAEKRRIIRVAVPNMVATGDDTALARTLTEVLTIEVAKTRGVETIGMADIEALLNHEQQKALAGCEDASCIAEIGGALGADALLSSKVGRVGDTYVLSIRLNDTRSAKQLGSAYETVTGKPDELIRVVQRKAPEVMRAVQPTAEVAVPTPVPRRDGLRVRVGSEEKSVPFQIVWPAVGVAAVGGLALMASGAVAAVSYFSFADGEEYKDVEVGRHVYQAPGAQEPFTNGKNLAWATVTIAAIGAAAIVGATAWQIIGGFAPTEEAAP